MPGRSAVGEALWSWQTFWAPVVGVQEGCCKADVSLRQDLGQRQAMGRWSSPDSRVLSVGNAWNSSAGIHSQKDGSNREVVLFAAGDPGQTSIRSLLNFPPSSINVQMAICG